MIGGGVRESPRRFDHWKTLHHRAHVLKAKATFESRPNWECINKDAWLCFAPPPLLLMSMDPVFSQRDAFYDATILLSCQLSWLDSSRIRFKVTAFYRFYWGGNVGIQLKFKQEEMVVIFFTLRLHGEWRFTLNDTWRVNSQRQIIKSDLLCNFSWIRFWVIYHQAVWSFRRNIWKENNIILFFE